MSGTSAKKAKLTSDSNSFFYGDTHDRVLLVENVKFHVQSEKLVEHSEYFRTIFSSDFIEKTKEIIELKEFKADKIKMFLDAVYTPEKLDIDDNNFSVLVELCVYFQSVPYLLELFKHKKIIEKISAEDILRLADTFAISDLKESVEEYLVKQFITTSNKKPKLSKSRIQAKTFKFEDLAMSGLDLSEEYQLIKLKLAIDFPDTSHFVTVVNQYLELLDKYVLPELTKAIEKRALSDLSTDCTEAVLKKFMSNNQKVEMKELKNAAESNWISEFTNYRYEHFAQKNLSYCSKWNLPNLKDKVRSFLLEKYEQYDVNKKNPMSKKDITELALIHDIEPLKGKHQDQLVQEFETDKNNYKPFIEKLAKYELPKLKTIVEEYLLEHFAKSNKEDALIEEFCGYSKKCKMSKLKDSIETHLVSEFRSTHDFKYMKLALGHEMKDFKATLAGFLQSSNLDDPLLKAGRDHLMNLPSEHHTFILDSLLRKTDEAESSSNLRGIFD